MVHGPRPPAMIGAYPDRESALASLPRQQPNSYDDEDVAEVNFRMMSELRVWDYPVLYWLNHIAHPGLRVLDAGGHFGTKYIAFSGHLPLEGWRWTVYDLPATVRAALRHQADGNVPPAIGFEHDIARVGQVDVLLASGLLQYLDVPLAALLKSLPNRPRFMVLNKVATRDGPTRVTLEKIGRARIPYQIRSRQEFERELSEMGYAIRDRWDIPSLSHVIDTHPGLGASISRGYFLESVE